MNRRFLILPLITLAALLTGVAATPAQGTTHRANDAGDYVRKTGTLATTWGELPTYSFQAKQLPKLSPKALRSLFRNAPLSGAVTLDLLVDRDGSIRDAAVVESSGDPSFDRVAQASFVGTKSTAKIAPGDPAPYVFRQKIALVSKPEPQRGKYDYIQNPEPTREPTYGPVDFYPPISYSYSTGSP